MQDIQALRSENTIVLHYKGETLNVQKDNELYDKLDKAIEKGNIAEVVELFESIKERVEKFTQGKFTVEGNQLILKGDKTPMPDAVAKKLVEMEAGKSDYMPLIRFWKKLKRNPSQRAREELYDFMLNNNIPITDRGDILVEKGVRRKSGGSEHDLVDCRTRKIDNSIGMVVSMERGKVDDRKNVTCSHGLHVGAPDYVRKHWSSDVIIECVVDPADVVSIPADYNDTKMRVCRYQVIRYADKSTRKEPVVKLEDLLVQNSISNFPIMSQKVVQEGTTEDTKVISRQMNVDEVLEKMTAKKIVQYVFDEIGVKIELSLKNKTSIIKKAKELLADRRGEEVKTVSLANLSAKAVVAKVLEDLEEDISPKTGAPRKAIVLKKAIALYKEKGFNVETK